MIKSTCLIALKEKHLKRRYNTLTGCLENDQSFKLQIQQKRIKIDQEDNILTLSCDLSTNNENRSIFSGSIKELLSVPTAKEKEANRFKESINHLLTVTTAKEKLLYDRFRIDHNIHEFCQYGTADECTNINKKRCHKVHFRRIIHPHTDISLGDCSFLNTCFHIDTCKYIHYEIDKYDMEKFSLDNQPLVNQISENALPPQWLHCDLRLFDISVLGKFSIVMADPPWDIHMELPYGTMADAEMRKLNVPCLQDDGFIFLWVTGRAMELGRECLSIWGYKRVDELVWVKTNQLQRIIRTGRTGHWLNHGKEHCLIGMKGDISKGKFNIGLDCDVIVSEVRETSRKPDEIYGICERLSPGTRKVELFGRPHNVKPNWITLGNQLEGMRLVESDVVQRFRQRYPDVQV